MSPIESHLKQALEADLRQVGVAGARVSVLSADVEAWSYRVETEGRSFEVGFNHRDLLWARETTAGRQKHLVSNDHAPVHASTAARARAVVLVARAVADAQFPPRDPPVI
ncbi:hypothetical protein [Opitutus sp. ER46]|uniref:hypothetical protein n=1 Tax=Opitutus sp. ER46 TaxID=2161864 RepID=UPI000D31736C|nr:hypothetical protein [Opitutus sp. ER46]PTX94400.1 hypothetical protein DB354_11655 [Opitutus sp. ER46]